MILVTLGTQDKSFKRLLKAIDKEIEEGHIKEKVIVQSGYTNYKSKNMEIFDLVSPEELEKLIEKSSLVITHGGVGSILGALNHEKNVIAAPRLKKYKEHTNDHQKEIVEQFEKEGYLLYLKDFNKLGDMIKQVKKFTPKKYKSNNKRFIKLLDNYINTSKRSFWNKYGLYVILIAIILIMLIIIF